ncbi:Ankyrin repeat-containing protein 17 [Elsinoe fawcettii]|nr:Ankyrin repeat-containing protein 17 [Elsinoe fawcettii]
MSDESFLPGSDQKTGRFLVLTASNFVEWLDLAEDVLLSKGLWKYAFGDATELNHPGGKIAFQKEDAKAVAFLKSAAGTEQRAHLLGIKSSKAVLDKLKAVHQVSQQERVQTLLPWFHGFKAQGTIDLSASRLTQLQLEIAAAAAEEKPTDTSKKSVLVQSNGTPIDGDYDQGLKDRGAHSEKSNAAWTVEYNGEFVHRAQDPQLGKQEWVLDSGCSRHMTANRGCFVTFNEDHNGTVTIANGEKLQVQGGGTIEVPIQGKSTQITGVLHVPDIGYNLLSIGQLVDRGMTCQFFKHTAKLVRNGSIAATATRYGKAYVLSESKSRGRSTNDASMMAQEESQSQLWHWRLGHPGSEKLKLMTSGAQTNKTAATRATTRLQRVHMDFWGLFKQQTIGGSRYMLTITDDYSRKSCIFLAATRTAVYEEFAAWRAQAERESKCKLRAVRMDNAPEFKKLAEEWKRDGIVSEFTAAYTPSQNRVAERLNRTLIRRARAMLAATELPKELWGEAEHTATYLKNRTPYEVDGDIVTPEERWTGRKPNLNHLRVFGCVAYGCMPPVKRDKLDATACKGVLVGYAPTTRQYRIFNPRDRTTYVYWHDVNAPLDDTQESGSALRLAVENGHSEVVRILLQYGADPNAATSGHRFTYPLQAAAGLGFAEIVSLLLDNDAEVGSCGYASFHDDDADEYNCDALAAAAVGGHMEIVRRLLDHEADVNNSAGTGWQTEYYDFANAIQAAAFGGHIEVIRLLIQHDADVNSLGGRYGTPLVSSAERGHCNLAELLTKNGADVNNGHKPSGSALYNASWNGHLDVVNLLLEKDAIMDEVLDSDLALWMWPGSNLEAAVKSKNYAIVESLLDRGANIHIRERFYRTPLEVAIADGDRRIINLLLERGANIENMLQSWLWKGAMSKDDLILVESMLARGIHSDSGSVPDKSHSNHIESDLLQMLQRFARQG